MKSLKKTSFSEVLRHAEQHFFYNIFRFVKYFLGFLAHVTQRPAGPWHALRVDDVNIAIELSRHGIDIVYQRLIIVGNTLFLE